MQLIRNLQCRQLPCGDGYGANAMTLNWTRGTVECIVIMHQAGAVTSTPTDGRRMHCQSSTFGSGTNIAANEYIVYMGSGNTPVLSRDSIQIHPTALVSWVQWNRMYNEFFPSSPGDRFSNNDWLCPCIGAQQYKSSNSFTLLLQQCCSILDSA